MVCYRIDSQRSSCRAGTQGMTHEIYYVTICLYMYSELVHINFSKVCCQAPVRIINPQCYQVFSESLFQHQA